MKTKIKTKVHLPHSINLSKTQRRRMVESDLEFSELKASSLNFLEILNQGMVDFDI